MTEKGNTFWTFLAVFAGFIVFVLIVGAGNAREPKFEYDAITIEVRKVIDGDTVTAIIENKEVNIRLYGIDAPESTQTYGTQAKDALDALIDKTKPVVFLKVTDDRYGRAVGVLYQNRLCINERMVIDGHAWHYPYSKPVSNIIRYHHKVARDAKVGLWAHPDPIPPWQYRKENK